MKTILTIGSSSMLLPANADPAAILKLMVGAKVLRNRYHYTKETKERPNGRHISAEVIQDSSERITVACVPDEDVCTEEEWAVRMAQANAQAEKETPLDLPKAA